MARERCSAVGCALTAKARGVCGGHYYQLYRETPFELRKAAGGRSKGGGQPRWVPVPVWLDLNELAQIDGGDQAWLHRDLPCASVPFGTFSRFRDAARVCRGCPYRLPCLARWLDVVAPSTDDDTGIYVGDTTPAQRRAIRRRLIGRRVP